MHRYGLLDSPSFITSESSDEDVLNEIGKIQKLLQPEEKCKQDKPKQIFERANNIQGPSLREFMLKLKHPIVTSTPQTYISPTNNLTLQLTTVPRRRDSIITGHAVSHFWPSVKKPSKKNSVSVTTSTKSKLSKSKKGRKSKKLRPTETSEIDLTGIGTFSKKGIFTEKLISQKTRTTDSLNNRIPQVVEGLDLGNSENALPDRSYVHKKNEGFMETSVSPQTNLTNQLKNLLRELDQIVASTNDNVKKNTTESHKFLFLKPFTKIHQLSDKKLRSATQVFNNITNSAEVKNIRASNNLETTEIRHKSYVSKDTTDIDQTTTKRYADSQEVDYNNTISHNTRSKSKRVVVDNNKENELTSNKQTQTVNRNIVTKSKRKVSAKTARKLKLLSRSSSEFESECNDSIRTRLGRTINKPQRFESTTFNSHFYDSFNNKQVVIF